jgi:hypothetical protein
MTQSNTYYTLWAKLNAFPNEKNDRCGLKLWKTESITGIESTARFSTSNYFHFTALWAKMSVFPIKRVSDGE